jgi:hypothetical protein
MPGQDSRFGLGLGPALPDVSFLSAERYSRKWVKVKETLLWRETKSIISLKGSQASPFRPSDKGDVVE